MSRPCPTGHCELLQLALHLLPLAKDGLLRRGGKGTQGQRSRSRNKYKSKRVGVAILEFKICMWTSFLVVPIPCSITLTLSYPRLQQMARLQPASQGCSCFGCSLPFGLRTTSPHGHLFTQFFPLELPPLRGYCAHGTSQTPNDPGLLISNPRT